MKSFAIDGTTFQTQNKVRQGLTLVQSGQPEYSDQDLLRAIGRGREQAMEDFYKRHGNAVYQFALKILNNQADAAEVLNEVMMQVWNKSDSFAGRAKVTTWLLSITHNKSVDLVRKKVRHDGNESIDVEPVDHQQVDLSVAAANAADAHQLRQCIAQLPLIHRQVLHLAFFEGLSCSEIGRVLEVPTGTVKTRMMHGKNRLLKLVTGEN